MPWRVRFQSWGSALLTLWLCAPIPILCYIGRDLFISEVWIALGCLGIVTLLASWPKGVPSTSGWLFLALTLALGADLASNSLEPWPLVAIPLLVACQFFCLSKLQGHLLADCGESVDERGGCLSGLLALPACVLLILILFALVSGLALWIGMAMAFSIYPETIAKMALLTYRLRNPLTAADHSGVVTCSEEASEPLENWSDS